jgi:hypothetical protein
MIPFIQSLEAHVYTFKEVAGYVTVAVCMAFSVGFLLAAYTRIFQKEIPAPSSGTKAVDDYIDWSKIPDGYDWVCLSNTEHTHLVKLFINEPRIEMGSMYEDWLDCTRYLARGYLSSAIIGPLPPWRESLRQRPKE